MRPMISCPQCLRCFCDVVEGRLSPEKTIELTIRKLDLFEEGLNIVDMTEKIIRHIETTPAYEDNIADAKLRLREMIEDAYFEIYPDKYSSMGLTLPLA